MTNSLWLPQFKDSGFPVRYVIICGRVNPQKRMEPLDLDVIHAFGWCISSYLRSGEISKFPHFCFSLFGHHPVSSNERLTEVWNLRPRLWESSLSGLLCPKNECDDVVREMHLVCLEATFWSCCDSRCVFVSQNLRRWGCVWTIRN